MVRTKIRVLTLASVLIAGLAGTASAASCDSEHDGEHRAALAAKISVEQAIGLAEGGTGGRAVKIEFEDEHGRYLYEIKTIATDRVTETLVDPASGDILRTRDEGLIERIFDREEKGQFAVLLASPTTLAEAVASAEQRTGATAVEAEVDEEDGIAAFQVELVRDNAVQTVTVDITSGAILNVANGDRDSD